MGFLTGGVWNKTTPRLGDLNLNFLPNNFILEMVILKSKNLRIFIKNQLQQLSNVLAGRLMHVFIDIDVFHFFSVCMYRGVIKIN